MKFIFINMLILSFLCSCEMREKKQIPNGGISLEFNFYPSSSINSIFKVSYTDGLVKVIQRKEKMILFERKLKSEENIKLLEILNKVEKRENLKDNIILDSWRLELRVNQELFFNKTNIQIDSLPIDVKNLLLFLIKDSPIKIDLYSFS